MARNKTIYFKKNVANKKSWSSFKTEDKGLKYDYKLFPWTI